MSTTANYDEMSLEALEAHAYAMSSEDLADFAGVRWALVKRRIIRDVYLDLSEDLSEQGWVVVPWHRIGSGLAEFSYPGLLSAAPSPGETGK